MKLALSAGLVVVMIAVSGCSRLPKLPSLPKLPKSGQISLFPGVHKIDIQQGNIVDQKMIDQLKPGMTRAQVRFVLGTPLIADTFDQSRWDYFYSYRTGNGDEYTETFSVFFKDDTLDSFRSSKPPETEVEAETEES